MKAKEILETWKKLKGINERDEETTEPSSEWSMGQGYRVDLHTGILYGQDDSEHTNDGYRLTPAGKGIFAALQANGWAAPKILQRVMVDKKGNITTVILQNNIFETRFNDCQKLIEAGLIGFRFEKDGGKMVGILYFRQK